MARIFKHTFTKNGTSPQMLLHGDVSVSIIGSGVATINLERSLDKGATWGTIKTVKASTEYDVRVVNPGMLHRLSCNALVSGSWFCQVLN